MGKFSPADGNSGMLLVSHFSYSQSLLPLEKEEIVLSNLPAPKGANFTAGANFTKRMA